MNGTCTHECEPCRLTRVEEGVQRTLVALTDAADALAARVDAQAEALDRQSANPYQVARAIGSNSRVSANLSSIETYANAMRAWASPR